MDGAELVSAVREDEATALSRLGSDKYLIAATTARLDPEPVLRSVAVDARHARDRFRTWAAESEGDIADGFETAGVSEAQTIDRIGEVLSEDALDTASGDQPDNPVAAAIDQALAASDDPVERVAAGLVGRPLVLDRTLLQVVNFFVNEADAARADLARDLRAQADDQLDTGISLLNETCTDQPAWERARGAAGHVVADAYGAYADALETMGVDPKPVC